MAVKREVELFPPVRDFLCAQGYAVRSEVEGCDVVAVRGDELVIVELKRSLSVALLLQGVARLRLTEAVYLAVEAKRQLVTRRREYGSLCRRLGLGLLFVHVQTPRPWVEAVCDPAPYEPPKSKARRARLLAEFHARSADGNAGGSHRTPLLTAYREQALRIAEVLAQGNGARVRDVSAATAIARAGEILRDNYYGWFARVTRGVYCLTPSGQRALAQYTPILAGSRPTLEQGQAPTTSPPAPSTPKG